LFPLLKLQCGGDEEANRSEDGGVDMGREARVVAGSGGMGIEEGGRIEEEIEGEIKG